MKFARQEKNQNGSFLHFILKEFFARANVLLFTA